LNGENSLADERDRQHEQQDPRRVEYGASTPPPAREKKRHEQAAAGGDTGMSAFENGGRRAGVLKWVS